MSGNDDPYWRLRPPPETPDEELCCCANSPPIMLQPHLSSNPISCILCNREVEPERIGFSEETAQEVAFWQSYFECFYRLSLDSGEFESWAKAQLEDPKSSVNTRALGLVSELNTTRRAYYWWFQDPDAEHHFLPPLHCPVCEAKLEHKHGREVCETCSIVAA